MSDLIAIAYPDESTARDTLVELRRVHAIELEEVVVVTCDGDGQVNLPPALSRPEASVAAGALNRAPASIAASACASSTMSPTPTVVDVSLSVGTAMVRTTAITPPAANSKGSLHRRGSLSVTLVSRAHCATRAVDAWLLHRNSAAATALRRSERR